MMEQYDILPMVKGSCHGNELKSKNRPISFVALPFWNRLQYRNSQNSKHNEFLYIVYNFGDILSSNPSDCEGNNCTLLDETAKIGISDQISK